MIGYGSISDQPLEVVEPLIASEEPLTADSIQVAFLADGLVPMPRLRPAGNTAFYAASPERAGFRSGALKSPKRSFARRYH